MNFLAPPRWKILFCVLLATDNATILKQQPTNLRSCAQRCDGGKNPACSATTISDLLRPPAEVQATISALERTGFAERWLLTA